MNDFPALDRLEQLAREFADRRRSLEEIARAAADIHAVGQAADGLVRVKAGPGGQVEAIRIDPRAMKLGSEALAEELTTACRNAADAYAEAMNETMSQALGTPGDFNAILRGAVGHIDRGSPDDK